MKRFYSILAITIVILICNVTGMQKSSSQPTLHTKDKAPNKYSNIKNLNTGLQKEKKQKYYNNTSTKTKINIVDDNKSDILQYLTQEHIILISLKCP
jgi:hypothetical protein